MSSELFLIMGIMEALGHTDLRISITKYQSRKLAIIFGFFCDFFGFILVHGFDPRRRLAPPPPVIFGPNAAADVVTAAAMTGAGKVLQIRSNIINSRNFRLRRAVLAFSSKF